MTQGIIDGLPILNKTGGSTVWFDAHPKVRKGVNRGKWTCDLWANVTSIKSVPDYVRLIVIVKP